jgi:hypothetical protein
MNTPQRGALMLVYFVAGAMIVLSLLEVGLYVADSLIHHLAIGIVHCVLRSVPFTLGIVILFRANAIADWVTRKFEE